MECAGGVTGWDGTTVKHTVTNYWQRRATEANKIRNSAKTMNLYSGLQLPSRHGALSEIRLNILINLLIIVHGPVS